MVKGGESMKKLITSIGLATAGVLFAAQAFAQTATPSPTSAATPTAMTTTTPTPTASVPQKAPSTGHGAY